MSHGLGWGEKVEKTVLEQQLKNKEYNEFKGDSSQKFYFL